MQRALANTLHGLRSLKRLDLLVLAAAFVFAIAVGASSALLDAVIQTRVAAPMGVETPHELVALPEVASYPSYQQVALGVRTADIASYARSRVDVQSESTTFLGRVECVTPNYFDLLGVRPTAGRLFTAKGDPTDGIVLSYTAWKDRFARDSSVIGRTISVGARKHPVLGVAHPGFIGLTHRGADGWVLLTVSPEVCGEGRSLLSSPAAMWLTTVGRLRTGFTLNQLTTEVNAIVPYQGAGAQRETASPIGAAWLLERFRGVLWREQQLLLWLLGGIAALLLMACSNVAVLFGLRATARRREIAVRYHLGATRSDILTLLIAESVGLALACCLAAWATSQMVAGLLGALLETESAVGSGSRTLGLLILITLLAGFASGLGPAIAASRFKATELVAGRVLGDRRRNRLNGVLLVLQIAVACALLMTGRLFARSVDNLEREPGYNLTTLVAVDIDPRRSHFRRDEDLRDIRAAIHSRLNRMQLGDQATLTSYAPLDFDAPRQFMMVRASVTGRGHLASVNLISHEYFDVVGTRIVEGRRFTPSDGPADVPVVVIDQDLAKRLWNGDSPIGKCLFALGQPLCLQVVGVTQPRRPQRLSARTLEVFAPLQQSHTIGSDYPGRTVLFGASGSLARAIERVREQAKAVAPALYMDVRPVSDLADVQTRPWRVGAFTLDVFGISSLCLAGFGIFCSMSLANVRRRSELALRVALGASTAGIYRLVLKRGLVLVALGWLLGTVFGIALAQLVRGSLVAVTTVDLNTYVQVGVAVWVVGLAGSIVPALRATTVPALRTLLAE